jgi:hypothetical protein
MLDVNTKALDEYSRKLETLSRSALPVAIRGALNDCAYDMKISTLLNSAKNSFIERQPNFFKANSSYDKAEGFNISSMKSIVGMTEGKLKGDHNYAVKDLEEQEEGGKIEKKSFIPMLAARKGGLRTMVRPNARLKAIKNIVVSSKAQGKNDGQKFVKSVYFAGRGGFVLYDLGGKQTLFRVNSLKKTSSNQFKLTPLYSYDKGRSVHVKEHHFVEKAGSKTHQKIDNFYINRANIAFEKHLR